MRLLFTALCMASAGFVQLASAQSTFATIIGADGRAINIPIQNSEPSSKQSSVSPVAPPAMRSSKDDISASSLSLNQAEQKVNAVTSDQPESTSQQLSQPVITADDFIDNDGVEYVDSELLEKKQFNLNNKKRFFPVPNQTGSIDYIERAEESVSQTLMLQPKPEPLYRVADNYSVLAASTLKDALPVECLTQQQIEQAERFSKRGTKNFWPTQSTQDFEYELVKLSGADQVVYLQSYESKSPGTFYWPLSVFLDKQGCVMQGVATYMTEWEPSTWIQKASLKGVLLAPDEAQYLLMTPMAQMPYREEYVLSRSGSISLQTGTVAR